MDPDPKIKIKMPTPYKIGEKIETLNKKGLGKIVPFAGTRQIEAMFYLYLLKKYKTNCFLHDPIIKSRILGLYIPIQLKYEKGQQRKTEKEIETHLDTMANNFIDCVKRDTKIIIIPIQLHFVASNSAHANILIYRKNLNQIEHFEPHGKLYLGKKEVDVYNNLIKIWIAKFVTKINKHMPRSKKIKLIDPTEVCPYLEGLQHIETVRSNLIKTADEPGGYCSAWSMFFTELSLKNPEIPSSILMSYVYEKFQNMTAVEQGNYLRSIIRGYAIFIDEKIEKYFSMFFSSGLTLEKLDKFTTVQLIEVYDILKFLINLEINLAINPAYINDILKDIDLELKDNDVKLDCLNSASKADAIKKKIIKDKIDILIQNKNNIQTYQKMNAIFNTPPTYTPTPSPMPIVVPINPCPEGKVLNPKTGRCIKDKTIKTNTNKDKTLSKSKSKSKTQKSCPEGKVLNPKTGRCIKDKTIKDKSIKDKSIKDKSKTHKSCPKGKVLNPKTGRCIKAKTYKCASKNKECIVMQK